MAKNKAINAENKSESKCCPKCGSDRIGDGGFFEKKEGITVDLFCCEVCSFSGTEESFRKK